MKYFILFTLILIIFSSCGMNNIESSSSNNFSSQVSSVSSFLSSEFSSSSVSSSISNIGPRYVIHYYTDSWTNVKIHYNDGSGWTTAPGKNMIKEGNNWWVYRITNTNSTSITFCFNNGANIWDNNNSKDYKTSSYEVWVIAFTGLFTNNPTSGTYKIVIHYNNSVFTDPKLWFWKYSANGSEISSVSNDDYGKIFVIETNGGVNYGFKFKQGSIYEPEGIDRYTGTLISNVEYWIVGESKALFNYCPTNLIMDPEDSSYTNLLGVNKTGELFNFVLFAPRSKSVSVRINNVNISMKLTKDGRFWWVRTNANYGDTYKYILDGSINVSDPYARANKYSNGDSIIIDPTFTFDNFEIPNLEKLVIYELHINDMTYYDYSVPTEHRGKYLGLTNKIPYLKSLGINAIEIMPLQEFPGIGYSWGYNNSLYFAPESDYATGNSGQQVTELKQMINEFHKNGIAVILDVVYNHTANDDNHLWNIDNDYYFDPAGTDWGNKLYIQRPMVKRLIYDNMKYWMDEYKVDGFRLDAVYVMDKPTVWSIISNLRSEGYSNQIYIAELFGDSYFKNKDVPTWSSTFRDNIKNWVKNGLTKVGGWLGLASTVWYCNDWGFFGSPLEAINYLESHDEETMGFYFGTNAIGFNRGLLATTILFTSLGVPMIYEGQEFHRVRASQDTYADNNRIKWNNLSNNINYFNYFSGLVNLRTKFDAFYPDTSKLEWAMNSSDWDTPMLCYFRKSSLTNFLICINLGSSSITKTITNFVIDGEWVLIANMTNFSLDGVGSSVNVVNKTGQITIPARSAYIYMNK